MTAAALHGWRAQQQALQEAREQHGERSARLTAAARIARQALQTALLGIGAWLVIGDHASPGIMVAATILFGRALQPIEQLIAGWKSFVEARAAWGRLSKPGSAVRRSEHLELPAPQGAVELERVVFTPNAHRVPLIKGVSFCLAAGESVGVVGPSASGKTTHECALGWSRRCVQQSDEHPAHQYSGWLATQGRLLAGKVGGAGANRLHRRLLLLQRPSAVGHSRPSGS